ncbi:hypothetical protein O3M35_006252 [Rhynocoris fuscipes]|uniref:Uncharacterized protein n=1 Tax=Rhynocoris fuscipes TaxID=488301 RepID=A0AAW1DHY3_9HEMI
MSGESKVTLKNNVYTEISKENDSVNVDSSQDISKVSSENISTSNEQRGVKRPLEEDSNKSDLPQVLKDMFKPLCCELCNVTVNTPVVAYAHYEGKTHKKNINSYMKKHFNVENTLKVKKTFDTKKCEVCDVILTSEIVYQQHLAGKQHKKKFKKSENPLIPVTKTEIDPTGRFGIGTAFLKANEQPSQSVQSNELYCEVCNVFTETEKLMLDHKQSDEHIKNVAKRKNVKTKNQLADYYNDNNVWQATVEDKKKE